MQLEHISLSSTQLLHTLTAMQPEHPKLYFQMSDAYLSYFFYVLFEKVLPLWRAIHCFVTGVSLYFVLHFAPARLTVQVVISQ